MKKKLRIVLIALLLIIGLTLIFRQQIKDAIVGYNTNNRLAQIDRQKIKQAKNAKASYDLDAVSSIDAQQITAAATDANLAYYGKIAIPAVKLKLPIVKGVSKSALATGAGTMKENEKMGVGNYALAGHHMINPNILFSPVTRTKVGQKIYVTDLKHVYTYRIDHKQVIIPTRINIISDIPGKKMITLITCAESGTKRWAVQGTLQKVTTATKSKLAIF
ncbi:class A sortase [Lapidilactobacillus bayanensis]|uniref:class A sortase n=1 Tax=Lapidilactobacillus bayanensis TaxID=2485998 RepID=UPI000F76F9CE|nr:class A sortase [Lapidilactobacillus bayanensis]